MNEKPNPIPLEYAPAPRPMSRKRMVILTAGAGATLVIGGVTYLMAQTTRPAPPVLMGIPVAPPALQTTPTTQPCTITPGKPASPSLSPATLPAEQ